MWFVAVAYFALVFGAGFFLAPFRIFVLAPIIGTRWAELLEISLMYVVMLNAARFCVRRGENTRGIMSSRERAGVGVIALILLLGAELALGVLMGKTFSEIVFERDPIAGFAFFVALVAFAIMPSVVQ
jgi:hypothetical protein